MARAGLILFAALPFVVWGLGLRPELRPLGALLDPWFSLLCHREPARTLVVLGARLPVCARCTGIYAGLLVGATVPWPRVSLSALAAAVGIGGALMLLDVATEAAGLRFPSLGVRLLTGLSLAWPAAHAAFLSDSRGG